MTFGIFGIFFGFIIAVIVTAMLPRQIGYIANKIEREIDATIDRIDEQTGDKISREEIERITAPNSKDDLTPIEKQFGPVIVSEIEDVRNARKWKRNKLVFTKGLRLYMVRHFSEKYSNNVQGFAYGGAALLIVIIGIRGLKFIPPTQPSILLAAITLEFSMLVLLAVTLFYTEEEQRMDKLMRNLEESSEGQKYELINLVRTSQQQQRDLASMVDYIQRQADNLQRRTAICERAYRLLVDEVGFPPEDIIFDPNVFAVATGIEEHASYGLDFIEATRWIKQNLPGAKVSGGISNVSFSFRGNNPVREAIHAVFLYHAIAAGLDMGIVNAGALVVYDEIDPELRERIEDVVLNRRPDAAERLLEIAEKFNTAGQEKDPAAVDEWRGLPLRERVTQPLVKGLDSYVEEDTEALRLESQLSAARTRLLGVRA